MKIAAAYDNGQIFQHFGKTEFFKFYEVENGKITDSQVVSTGGASHGAIADFLKQNGAEKLICGGLGEGAQEKLRQNGIVFFAGVSGDADDAVSKLLENKLEFSLKPKCESGGCSHHKQ